MQRPIIPAKTGDDGALREWLGVAGMMHQLRVNALAKLHFYYSAMNAGKSTTLLQSSYNYNERGMDTLIFVPEVDDRYGVGKVTTRIGLRADAITVKDDFDIYRHVREDIATNPNIKCVLVDEAQFLSQQQVQQLCLITEELNRPVLAYGIRTDFQGEPFVGSKYLLALADELIEIKTICHCGRKAIMNLRTDETGGAVREGNQIEVGGNDLYVATCRRHFRLGEAVNSLVPVE